MSRVRAWSPLLLVAAAFGVSLAAWGRLPAEVPIHFGIDGTPDGWGSRAAGALLLPAVMAMVLVVLRALPMIDPRRENLGRMAAVVDVTIWGALGTLLAIHVAVIAYALGYPVNITTVALMSMGALLVVMGAVLPRAQPNWFFGIRTPWTLSNDRVWERTHRAGGRVLLAAGVLMLAAPLFPSAAVRVLLPAVGAGVVLFSLGFSYVAWRQETRR